MAADRLQKSSTSGAHTERTEAVAASMRSEALVKRMSPPTVIADAIGKAVTARRPKTRYAAGFGARPLIALRRFLPYRTFDSVVSRSMGLPRWSPGRSVRSGPASRAAGGLDRGDGCGTPCHQPSQ